MTESVFFKTSRCQAQSKFINRVFENFFALLPSSTQFHFAAKALLLSSVLSIFLAPQAFGTDHYVAQTATGNGSGSDTNNFMSLATLNTWAGIQGGDVVHLCGTFTNQFTPGAGSPGNPVTIHWEPNAAFSRPSWNANEKSPTYHSSAILQPGNLGSAPGAVHDVIFDGGFNGVISCTQNGQGQPITNSCFGIWMQCGKNVEIRNLLITNLFYRTEGTCCYTNNGNEGEGATAIYLQCDNGTNILVHNNTLDMMCNGVEYFMSGWCSNIWVYSNTITRFSQGIVPVTSGSLGAGYIVNSGVSANTLNDMQAWCPSLYSNGVIVATSPCGQWYHNSAIFIIGGNPYVTSTNVGFRVERNYVGPKLYVGTSGIAFTPSNYQDGWPGLIVANNIIVNTNAYLAPNWALDIETYGALVANNTIIGYNAQAPGSINQNHGYVYNNLVYYGSTAIAINAGGLGQGVPYNSDYNVWGLKNPSVFVAPGSGYYGWSYWTNTYHFDLHSVTNEPSLSPTFAPSTTDVLAAGRGTNLTWTGLTTDFSGNPRPATGNWTIGAFQSTSASGAIPQVFLHTNVILIPNH